MPEQPIRAACSMTTYGVSNLLNSILLGSKGLDHAGRPAVCSMVESGGGLSEGYVLGQPGICLGNGQTEASLSVQKCGADQEEWGMHNHTAGIW